jgi:hypothetical protein
MFVRLHLEGKITHVVDAKNSCVNLNLSAVFLMSVCRTRAYPVFEDLYLCIDDFSSHRPGKTQTQEAEVDDCRGESELRSVLLLTQHSNEK